MPARAPLNGAFVPLSGETTLPILAADTYVTLRETNWMNAAYQTYRQTQAQTAAPGELIVMLYRGAVRFVASGIEGIEANNVEVSHNNLVRAQAVINELLESS